MEIYSLIKNILSNIFKRNRIPLEIKLLAVTLFLHGMGVRRIRKVVQSSKSSVHEWTLKFRQVLNFKVEKKRRRCIAIDETKLRVNQAWYYIHAAMDAETKELIVMKAYTSRNYLNTLDFIKRVTRFCTNRDFEIITDKMPCYEQVCRRLGVRWRHETVGRKNCIEHVFRSFKFVTMRFNHCLCVDLRKVSLRLDRDYWFTRVLYLLELWCGMFMFYWNVFRR